MNPLQASPSVHNYTMSPLTGKHSEPGTPRADRPALSRMEALPTSVQVGNLTFHVGRLMTTLSDSEAELLHSALHGETPKEIFSTLPDHDGVYSYLVRTEDYSASALLPRFPERMMVTCLFDPNLGLKNLLICDAKPEGEVYCQAYFEPPAMATRTPSPSSHLAAQYSRGQLAQAMIRQHNTQDLSGEPLPSGASVSTQSMVFSNDGSAGVPGPSRTQPNQSARSEPYPASSQSGASSLRGRNARVPDPEHPGETISRNALSKRKHDRQPVPDPEHPGETISRHALNKRQSRARAAARAVDAQNT